MQLHTAEIIDTFAEAFAMWAARVVITAQTARWADAAATSMTGFATSVIGCKCEAGVDQQIPPDKTPDLRPGVAVLLFTPDEASLGKRLVERIVNLSQELGREIAGPDEARKMLKLN